MHPNSSLGSTGYTGVQTQYAQHAVDSVPTMATVGSVVSLASRQAGELCERAALIAQSIAGPNQVPASPDKATPPAYLIDLLNVVSQRLQSALSEIERAQRSL